MITTHDEHVSTVILCFRVLLIIFSNIISMKVSVRVCVCVCVSLCHFFLSSGKLQQLLSFSELFPEELEEFLSSHQHLLWLHQLAIHSYSKVSLYWSLQCVVNLASAGIKYYEMFG